MADEIKDKALYSQKYLQAKGLSPYAAAGIVGNLKHESNFSTTVLGDKGTAEGIAQWRNERRSGLHNFAANRKKDWKDLDTQLDYILFELNQTNNQSILKGLRKATSAEEATKIFMNEYERPSEEAKRNSIGSRVQAANKALSGVGNYKPEYTYEEEKEVTPKMKNFFPDYKELSPEESNMLKIYADETMGVAGNIRTPQSRSDIAKQRILQRQNEMDFMAELSNLDLAGPEPEQEAPQQQQSTQDLYKAPKLNLPEYEQIALPMAQDGMTFTKIPTANFENNKTSKSTEKEQIVKLQKKLINEGYDLGKYGADGIIGPVTRKAIQQYDLDQKKQDISRTVKLGTETKPKPFNTVNTEIPVNKDNKDFFRLKNKIDKIDATIDNIARGVAPIPKNVSSFINLKATGSNEMNTDSFSKVEKTLLYNLAESAIERTGKTTGGIEYEDYSRVMPKEDYEQLSKVVNGNVNPVTGLLLGASSPGFNIGTTLGRFSYAKNKETGEIAISDSYDFVNNYTQDSKTGKLKSGYMSKSGTAYQKERKNLAEKDQGMTEKDLEKRKIGVIISPKDIEDTKLPTESSFIGKKIYDYNKLGGQGVNLPLSFPQFK